MNFALGSCRYIGNNLDLARADQPFAALLQRLQDADAPAFCLMLGDQIYVDASAGVLQEDARLEIFWERYQDAWNSPHASALLRQLPVYQMLDDHEIQNDWEAAPRSRSPHAHAWDQMAQACFVAWQWSHSPRNAWPPAPDSMARHFWYHFRAGGLPFFMLDTRLERGSRYQQLQQRQPAAHIISAVQMDALCDWLLQQQALAPSAPKFILSPSVLAPLASREAAAYRSRGDGWHAYPASLAQLGGFLLDHGIQHVVFLSGDLHAHFACELEFADASQRITAWNIVSSPCHAPFHFINSKIEDMHQTWQEELETGLRFSYRMHWGEERYQGFLLMQLEHDNGCWEMELQRPDRAGALFRCRL